MGQAIEDPDLTLEEEVIMLRQIANTTAIELAQAKADSAHFQNLLAESNQALPESAQAVQEKWLASWIDRYEHEIKLRQHARQVLTWQSFASYAILLVVIAVTSLGVYLSYVEVKASLDTPEKALSAVSQQNTGSPPTELIVSFQKLQVTSAVTGVVILVLSLGFLYLFLDRVFELEPHDFLGKPAATEQVGQAPPLSQ